jgi:ribonuclease HI
MPTVVDREGPVGAAEAYADASLQGRDAAWAAVVYVGQRPIRASIGAGDAPTIGEAERRAILLAADLLRDLERRGPVYSDSREAVAECQSLIAAGGAVTAVVWTPAAYNRAADVLSKLVRQSWQRQRKRPATPSMRATPLPAYTPLARPGSQAPRPLPKGPAPHTLEEAILAVATAGEVLAAELAERVERLWPDLLALRGRPEHSVRDALRSLVRKGEVCLDPRGVVVPTRTGTGHEEFGASGRERQASSPP